MLGNNQIFQFVKYGVVGVMATLIQLVAFYVLASCVFACLASDDWAVRVLNLPSADVHDSTRAFYFAICTTLGFIVSNFACWVMNRLFVFEPGKFKWYIELGMFYAASSFAALLAIGLSWLCINYFGLMTTMAVFIEIIVSFMVNYFTRKFFIFKG